VNLLFLNFEEEKSFLKLTIVLTVRHSDYILAQRITA
jgi:hypothetical protein